MPSNPGSINYLINEVFMKIEFKLNFAGMDRNCSYYCVFIPETGLYRLYCGIPRKYQRFINEYDSISQALAAAHDEWSPFLFFN